MPVVHHRAKLRCAACALTSVLAASAAHGAAVSPIKLEKLLTGKGQVRVDSSLLYAPGYLTTTGVGSTGQNLPVATEVQGLDINTLSLNLTLSYGLGKGTEISVGASRSYNRTAGTFAPFTSESQHSWDGVSVGISRELYSSAPDKLVLIGSASLDLARPVVLGNGDTRRVHGRSGTVGLSLNKVVDPMVLSLSATYAHGISGTFNGQPVREPSIWSLSPMVTFQANERIGLGWGAQFSRIGAREVDLGPGAGLIRIGAQSQTSFLFSMNYQLSKSSAMVASYSFPTLQSAAPVFTVRLLSDLDW